MVMKLNLLLMKTSGIYCLKNFHTSSLVYGAISVMGKYTEAAGAEPKKMASATPLGEGGEERSRYTCWREGRRARKERDDSSAWRCGLINTQLDLLLGSPKTLFRVSTRSRYSQSIAGL